MRATTPAAGVRPSSKAWTGTTYAGAIVQTLATTVSSPLGANFTFVTYPSRPIVVARRSDLKVDVDEHFKSSQAGVGVRVSFHVQTFLAAPAGAAVIDDLPTT